ncbi:EamA family transporter [Candidatus Saccharibacteria bacterium]|nr:EamA family transporter [Candidatus Saccharibacteria bacterium]
MLDNPHLWLFLVGMVSTVAAIRIFIDNYVVDVVFRKTRPEAIRIAGVFSFALLLLVLLIVAPPTSLPIMIVLALMGAGLVDAIGSPAYSHALKYEEATSIAVLKQLHPIIALGLGWLLLGDGIGWVSVLAFMLIFAAASLIVMSKGKRQKAIGMKAVKYITFAVTFWALSDIIFIALTRQVEMPFMTAFFWWSVGRWIGDIGLMLVFKSWRTRFMSAFRNNRTRFLVSVSASEFLRTVGNLVWRQATVLAPVLAVAVVTERTAQLLLIFGLGLALSTIWPKFGRENMRPRVVLVHLVAVALAAGGVALLQLGV